MNYIWVHSTDNVVLYLTLYPRVPTRVRSTDTLVLYSTPFGIDPKPKVRSTDNVVLYSTPVSRQTDKFDLPEFPIYSKILRDLRVPFPFPKSEGNFWAETSGGDADAAAVLLSNF